MKPQISRRIGWRFLVSEWLDPQARVLFLVALLGMSLGLATFLVSQSILSAFQNMYRQSILGFNAHVIVVDDPELSRQTPLNLPQGFGASMSHFTFQEGVLMIPGGMHSVMLKGVDATGLTNVYDLRYGYLAGQGPQNLISHDTQKPAPILLGKKIYDDWLTTNKSGIIQIIIPKENGGGMNLRDLSQSFEVIGYFESGLYEFDSKFALMDESTLKALSLGTSSGSEIRLDKPEEARALAALMQESASPGTEIISWDDLNSPLFVALKMEKLVFLIVMSCIVLIATLNIGGVILMILFKRSNQAQILRLLGMTRSQVAGLFRVQTGFMVGLTLLFGFVLSLGLSWLFNRFKLISLDPQIYMVEGLKFDISLEWFLLAAVAIVVVSFFVSNRMSGWVLGRDIVLREKE